MKFRYTIIYVADVPKTVEFYESAFGLQRRFLHESGTYAEMETGETALAFAREDFVRGSHAFAPNTRTGLAAGAEVGLVTDDVPHAFERAVKAGAEIVVTPLTKPWGQVVSYVRDINGFLVEICSAVS